MYFRTGLIRVLIPLIAALTLAVPALATDTYEVDPVHSSIIFKIRHNNVSFIYGRFNEFSGNIVVDEADPANSSVSFTVQTGSIDTINPKRDEHLRSGDFFEAEGFPEITFSSTSVRPIDDDTFEVTGDVHLRGETVPITTTVELTGRAENRDGKPLLGFETTFEIDRTAFGMDYGTPNLGANVQVTVAAQAGLVQPADAAAADNKAAE